MRDVKFQITVTKNAGLNPAFFLQEKTARRNEVRGAELKDRNRKFRLVKNAGRNSNRRSLSARKEFVPRFPGLYWSFSLVLGNQVKPV